MRYLHTMLRVRDLDRALDFYCNALGLKETRRRVDDKNRYTNVFLTAADDERLLGAARNTSVYLFFSSVRRRTSSSPSRLQ